MCPVHYTLRMALLLGCDVPPALRGAAAALDVGARRGYRALASRGRFYPAHQALLRLLERLSRDAGHTVQHAVHVPGAASGTRPADFYLPRGGRRFDGLACGVTIASPVTGNGEPVFATVIVDGAPLRASSAVHVGAAARRSRARHYSAYPGLVPGSGYTEMAAELTGYVDEHLRRFVSERCTEIAERSLAPFGDSPSDFAGLLRAQWLQRIDFALARETGRALATESAGLPTAAAAVAAAGVDSDLVSFDVYERGEEGVPLGVGP